MLLFSTRPFFHFFLNLLRAALLHHLDTGDTNVLTTLVARVNDLYSNHSTMDTINIFNVPIAVDMPSGMAADHFAGASLLQVRQLYAPRGSILSNATQCALSAGDKI